jgi:hypothetical protein
MMARSSSPLAHGLRWSWTMHEAAKHASMTRGSIGVGLALAPSLGWTARRLARFRNRLAAAMMITGAPVMALYRAESPTVRHVVMVLAILWLSMVLPMARLLCLEWQTNRALETARSGH